MPRPTYSFLCDSNNATLNSRHLKKINRLVVALEGSKYQQRMLSLKTLAACYYLLLIIAGLPVSQAILVV